MIISEWTYNVKHFNWHGIIEYQKVGDCAVINVFGINFFARVGDLSCLFGIDWVQS